MTPVDYVSGPHGQVLGGLGPEQVCLDAESRAGPSGKEELGAGVGRPPVGTRLDQAGSEHTRDRDTRGRVRTRGVELKRTMSNQSRH